ncbi:MAG: carboxypeptidase-like regulatory domain-containing protein [Salibacteraceae bacterium]
MLKKLLSLFILAVVVSVGAMAQAGQSEIKGKIIDKEKGEPLPFVNIILERNGVQVTGAQTDFDGNFSIKPIEPGTYTLKSSSVGFKPIALSGIVVTSEEVKFVDVKMESTSIEMKEFVKVEYKNKLIDKGNTAVKATVSAEDFGNMAVRSAADVAKNTAGVYSSDDGTGNLNIRGARSDANYYYIDGMKVLGSSNLPKSAIGEISVISGGLPAQYGDVTGGVISITTKGPSSEYHGAAEYLTSGFKLNDKMYGLDAYGYNVLEASLSGPLLMKKDSNGNKTKEPIVGFFVSGNYTNVVDNAPSAIGMWKIKDDELAKLKSDPVTTIPGYSQTIQSAELLRADAFEKVKTRQNVGRSQYVINGKLDFNTGKTTNLTFGGSYNGITGNIGGTTAGRYNNSLYNYEHNAKINNNDWRVFGRFVQRFANASGDAKSKSSVSNAFYSIQFGYNERNTESGDPVHGDDFWKYGYVGKFQRFQDRTYESVTLDPTGNDSLWLGHDIGWVTSGTYNVQTAFEDTLIGFTAGDVNPEMAAYTQGYYDVYGWEGYDENGNPIYDHDAASTVGEANTYLRNQENVLNGGGYLNGSQARDIYGVWNSHAAVNNNYRKSKSQQYRVSLMGSADIKEHAVSVGFEYEQRVQRSYSIAPRGLWTIGNLRTNSHLQNLDEMNPTVTSDQTNATVSYERLNAAPGAYRGEVNEDAQSFFDYNLRKNLGLYTDGNDFVDFNSLSPEQLNINYFSASELLNNGNNLVTYYGYDAYGNQTTGSSSVSDYFNQTDEFGNYTRPIDAFRPNYVSGWIQDKYAFDDLVFNVGIRVDRLDLNQSVLKDEYVLLPTVKAGENEVQQIAGDMEGDYSVPSNIGDDYVVYVDDIKNPSNILGYRDDHTWYNSEGVEVASADNLVEGSGFFPLLVDKENTRSSDMNANSFEDYTPQVNVMPRIAFSFPINDDALFFAHYDVLTRRPTANGVSSTARLNIVDYYYMDQAINNNPISNPNLKPSQTVDYAVGFKQVITGNSSITLETFYRELRDMVQVVGIQDAYPKTYMTYGNIDFGTVKGLILSYDLRRTKNIRLTASYTLQFASGTGSDAFSAQNLVRSGRQSLRNTSPLNYDQRHNIVANFDYRFGMGKAYDGPSGAKWLEGVGANFIFNVGSGTPYSRQNIVTGEGFITPKGSATLQGSVNGSRLPWQFKMDFRLDKDIVLAKDSKHPMNMNVYLQMFNVLNSLNVRTVYRYTGLASDDGYLKDARYQNDIESTLDPQSFSEQYSMKINNPGNYNLPRRTRIGVMVTF